MVQPGKYKEWRELHGRILEQERDLARARAAVARGERVDAEMLSVQQSEIRALRALSRALIRRAVASPRDAEHPGR